MEKGSTFWRKPLTFATDLELQRQELTKTGGRNGSQEVKVREEKKRESTQQARTMDWAL